MWINTSVLGLADPALGPSAWIVYWLYWAGLLYGPLLGAMVLAHVFQSPLRWPVLAPLAFAVLLLATMEARFVCDARVSSLLVDYPAFVLGLFLLFRRHRAPVTPPPLPPAA